MLRLLSERDNGIMSPLLLRRAQRARRHLNLELSKHTEVEAFHKGSVNSLDLDLAENRYLLSGGSDSTISIYDTQGRGGEGGQGTVTYPRVCGVSHSEGQTRQSVETVQWYPVDTGLFTSSGAAHQLRVWDTNCLKTVDTYTFSTVVYSHHLSPVAGKHCLMAVGAGRSSVKLVDLKSGSACHQLKGHDDSVLSVRWSTRNEFLLASSGADKKVILWDVRKAKGCLRALDHDNSRQSAGKTCGIAAHDGIVNSMQFTPDGLHLVTFGTDHRVRVWETSRGQLLALNFGVVNNTVKKGVGMEVVSDCTPTVLFVPSDSTIAVYDLFKGDHLANLCGHFNDVNCCVSHPHTQFLFSGGLDRNLLVWSPEGDSQERALPSPEDTAKGEGGRVQTVTADTWSSDEDNT
ncbi:hypothetical protein ACOMHN_014506 [Nucella lapillus]